MKKLLVSTLALIMIFTVVTPVLAEQDGDNDSSWKKNRSSTDWESKKKQKKEEAAKKQAEIEAQKQQRIAELQAEAAARKLQLMQDKCERMKDKLNAVPERVERRSRVLLGVMDRFYEKVQNFYDSGQLTVENYDQLKNTVDNAQTAAAASVEALDGLSVEVDCSNPDIGTQLDAIRAGANETKQLLKDYRSALVDLISAMKSAAEADDTGETESGEATQ